MVAQSQYLNTISAIDIASDVPVQNVSHIARVEQVFVVLDGQKKDEYVLESALQYARNVHSTLVLIHTHKASAGQSAELYLKSIKNKLMAHYDNVQAFLYESTDKLSALYAMIDDSKQTCVILQEPDGWLQRFARNNAVDYLSNRSNVQLWRISRQ